MRVRFVVFIFLFASLAGCQPALTPPDLVSRVIGTYKLSSFVILDNQAIPTAGVSTGSVVMTRDNSGTNTVKFVVSYILNNSGIETKLARTQVVELKESANTVDLYSGNSKIGTLAASVITVHNYVMGGFTVDFTATK